MKKLLAILLSVVMVLSLLAGCGESGNAGSSSDKEGCILDERTVVVGVLKALWTDRTGIAIERYSEYLEANLNVEIKPITIDSSTAEEVVKGTENAITAGCDIVISTYSIGLDRACQICQDAGVAFGLAYVNPTEAEIEILKTYDNFIGTVCPTADGHKIGAFMADTLIDEGYDNFAVVAFTPGMIDAVDQRSAGFQDRAKERGANLVYVLEEAPGPSMITAVTTMLEAYGDEIDYVISYGGGADFTVPAMTASGLNIPIAVPQLPTDFLTYFETGLLDYVLGFNEDVFALLIATGVNYLDGNTLPGFPEDKIVECSNVVLRDVETSALYDSLCADGTFTADELKSCIIAYNPDATFEDLNYLAQNTDIAGIQLRRGSAE